MLLGGMKKIVLELVRVLICCIVGILIPMSSSAANYPDRPIKFIVPFPGGGNSDILARVLAEGMSKNLGQPVIVENKAGAAGQIGNQFVVNAKPDGYTILLGGMSTQILLVGTAPD